LGLLSFLVSSSVILRTSPCTLLYQRQQDFSIVDCVFLLESLHGIENVDQFGMV
jgi:hypothetical protein